MRESAVCDVYFWSGATGLIEFPEVTFRANPSTQTIEAGTMRDPYRTVKGLSTSEPTACYEVAEAPADRELAAAIGMSGLLWTVRGEAIPDMIPAVLTDISMERIVRLSRMPSWRITIHWESAGPAVIEGFSEARVIPREAVQA